MYVKTIQKGVISPMNLNKEFPSVVKYMGSKTDVLTLIENGMNYLDRDYKNICDLFAGSATLSAALRGNGNIISNDIQTYSSVFAKTYFSNYTWSEYPDIENIFVQAEDRVNRFNKHFKEYDGKFLYDKDMSLEKLNDLEKKQRDLINKNDWNTFDDYYLFVKYYSGTYWSYDQCVWIDSYRSVIEKYHDQEELYNLLLSCLIYAMAYNSQSTGHYAQYRIPENDSSKEDILIYRRKNLSDFFIRKYYELRKFLNKDHHHHISTTTLTDLECLNQIPEHSLVYADPPYCFVHYSRFYHVLETLIKYDYPKVQYKGRYRDDRYQSGYCKKTEVSQSFSDMFIGIRNKHSDMILSYSNSDTNTIEIEKLMRICCEIFNRNICTDDILDVAIHRSKMFFKNKKAFAKIMSSELCGIDLAYEISIMKKPYNHSRMGRKDSKTIKVTEVIIIAKFLY